MNLFRSEEHVRNWIGFKSGTEEGIVDLSVLAKLFSVDTFTRRLEPDYVSRREPKPYLLQFLSTESRWSLGGSASGGNSCFSVASIAKTELILRDGSC